MKKSKLEDKLLQKCLPILDKSMQDEHSKMVSLFKDIIVSKKEKKAFFNSPVKYMKKNNIITINTLEISEGEKVELYDDKTIIKALRKSRELYKKNPKSISIPGIENMFLFVSEDVAVHTDWTYILCCTFLEPDEIRKIDFGPLMAPSTAKKIKKLLNKKTISRS